MRVDAPAQVALFAYDNDTFIVQSYLGTETDATISVPGGMTRLHNLVTGEVLTAQPANPGARRGGRGGGGGNGDGPGSIFKTHLLPHSYEVFAVEK